MTDRRSGSLAVAISKQFKEEGKHGGSKSSERSTKTVVVKSEGARLWAGGVAEAS